MSEGDKYFTFPLAVLHAGKSPTECLELAIRCGVMNAGIGYRKKHDVEEFEEKLESILEDKNFGFQVSPTGDRALILVGSEICNVSLGGGKPTAAYLDRFIRDASSVPTGGALVKMAGKYLWPAIDQARAESDPSHEWPERGISWREFRILCAILSNKTNRAGFTFIGWESIQARACGFTTKEQLRTAETIPDHLAPPLSRKQIRFTCDALEDLGFFARFRFSSGGVGGHMAYSFRHSRDELAKAVCDSANFRDRAKIKANRAEDAKKCLELLERAKVGPSKGQQGGQG